MKPTDPFEQSYAGRLRAKVGNDLLKLPGACVAILDAHNRVLLERGRGYRHWRLIGGIAEERESLLQCALRETLEETNLTLYDLKPFGFCDNPDHVVTLDNGHILFSHTMLFFTTHFSGELKPDPSELEACTWFPRTALPDTVHTKTRLQLEALDRFQHTGAFQLI